ncbi:MAG: lysophospholipid acyltransferase family protein [Bacillota bacterium]
MATAMYYIFVLLITLASILIFDLTTYTLMTAVYIILSILAALIIAFIMMLLFLALYGQTMRKVEPKNMRHHRMINSLFRLAIRLMRVKLVVTGKENIPKPGETFVFVCNHQENYDIIAIKPVFKDLPLNFIAKEEVFTWPVLGEMIRKLGNIPIAREADRKAIESILKGIKHVKNGIPMGIFPEGKRTFTNDLTDFKPGAFKLAMKPKADILIGTIYNFSNIFKGWPFKRQKVYFHIHPLLTYDTYKTMNSIDLSNHVKAQIQAQLDNYSTQLQKR